MVKGDKLFFKDKIVIPCDSSLIKEVLELFHDSRVGGHEGVHKTWKRVRNELYWADMKKDIKKYVKDCQICQASKYERIRPPGLLQPLPIPSHTWTDLSMDFIEKLPSSQKKEVILMVVDRLSKGAHFIPLRSTYTVKMVAKVFLQNVARLYGMPKTITCDRDPAFLSRFWKEYFTLMGTKICFSTASHPQTDGQTEVVNRTLETYLRCFTSEKQEDWMEYLPWGRMVLQYLLSHHYGNDTI